MDALWDGNQILQHLHLDLLKMEKNRRQQQNIQLVVVVPGQGGWTGAEGTEVRG